MRDEPCLARRIATHAGFSPVLCLGPRDRGAPCARNSGTTFWGVTQTRASETCEVILEGCRVPGSQLLGAEGRGFIDALQVLDAGRVGIAALAVGLAQGAFEAARQYALARRQFGQSG